MPLYKIKIEAVFGARPAGKKWRLVEMTAQHIFVNGNTVERSEQYVDRVREMHPFDPGAVRARRL